MAAASADGLRAGMASDVVLWMFTFLEFADMGRLSTVSSQWPAYFRDRRLYARIAHARWMHESVPSSYRFDLTRLAGDWKSHCLRREEFLRRVEGCDDDLKSAVLSSELIRRTSSAARMEILRIYSELHHAGGKLGHSKRSHEQMLNLVSVFRESDTRCDDLTQLLSARAIGILSAHEGNREVLMDAIPELMRRIRAPSVGTTFLHEALWSLVILCRPRGGVEGRPFTDDSFWQFRATHVVTFNDGVTALLKLIDDHRDHPMILSRVFWLLVNLCLCPSTKIKLQRRDVAQRVVDAMRRFPHHEELQHRAIFAAINLCVADPRGKERIFGTGVIGLMFQAMDSFPDSEAIHRYSCCVIRALRFDNDAMRVRLVRLGVVPRVEAMIEHFPNQKLLLKTARQTLTMFQS